MYIFNLFCARSAPTSTAGQMKSTIIHCHNGSFQNPFMNPRAMRMALLEHVQISQSIEFNGKGFICALITSRCHVGCNHCMFGSSLTESRNKYNTMTEERILKLMQLVKDSNTGYLLVSGGGEGFLEPDLLYKVIEKASADITWIVTSAFWGRDRNCASEIIDKMFQAYKCGIINNPKKKICLRISLDSYHVSKIAKEDGRFEYIENIIRIFESRYFHQDSFFIQFHCLQGEMNLVGKLQNILSASISTEASAIHGQEKITESVITLKLPSGFKFEITFAKLLLSDLVADLRDSTMLNRRMALWDKDAFENEQDKAACMVNIDGSIGPDMLVIYDGRVAGGWQSEMPDVSINIDVDSYQNIMNKTLTDPGVLSTIEKGLSYRFKIISEVSPKSCMRAKAVNIRDYTSLILLEEDAVKLYYTLRSVQDYVAEGRITPQSMDLWPLELRRLIETPKNLLKRLFLDSSYDIVKQFEETEIGFDEFLREIRVFAKDRDEERFIRAVLAIIKDDLRRLDKWRVLLRRIVHGWYDIVTLNATELNIVQNIERSVDVGVLKGRRLYDELSGYRHRIEG